ncbi:hypothetical protein [Streptomyces sp. NPDC058291]|uniref:hypothetical protein n=1 Tax=Streptomyces sp. NPDC058291 TaxID=3346427 RepID=UPI0036F05A16
MEKAIAHGLPQRQARHKAKTENLTAAPVWPTGATYSVLADRGTSMESGTWSGQWITEPLLRDFLELLEAMQEELNSRWDGQGRFGRHENGA